MPTHPNASVLAANQAWRKSSYSDGNGTNCVETTDRAPAVDIAVRDSKNPTGPALLLPATAWAAFVTHLHKEL
ncbi:DUF397 domain-containing protein [Streptomyces geranii]|uniref:DUF397 domain-containing protein n=1 Tax=Streptomyces geranii TaxID=2058923 RepID=UPI000D02F31A|nr:DUF397 domain-containing protein [Streptomyces geranii]